MIATFMLFLIPRSFCNIPPLHHEDIEYYAQEEISISKLPQIMYDFYSGVKIILTEVKDMILNIPSSIIESFSPHAPHSHEDAVVRHTETDDICPQEKEFIEKRLKIVQEALKKKFNRQTKPESVPRIAFCFSGGGFRSMILTLGFLLGAQETGLLDSTMYMAGLSGSTWAIAPWLISGKDLMSYTNELHRKIASGIDHIDTPAELRSLLKTIATKVLWKQYISAIDIYGAILANTLLTDLGPHKMHATLSETHNFLSCGYFPLPIYTAIQSNLNPYQWMEITPFEIGSSFLKSYIPVWAYGRKFENGISIDRAPEQTLGYFLGVCGSAFEVNLEDIIRLTAFNATHLQNILPAFLDKPIQKLLGLVLNSPLGEARLFPSLLRNYTYQMENSPLKDQKNICLVDAGIDFNLPIPPLLRKDRNIDIIIIYDASASFAKKASIYKKFVAKELEKAEKYARQHGLKFPEIDYDNIHHNLLNVFMDPEDSSMPVIIYFPLIQNDYYSDFDPEQCTVSGYCGTFNLQYAKNQIDELGNLSRHTLKHHIEDIKKVIELVIHRNEKQAST